MITVAVDTNILVDSLMFGSEFVADSRARLAAAREKGRLIICEVVQTELASFIRDESCLTRFLRESRVKVERSAAAALEVKPPGRGIRATRSRLWVTAKSSVSTATSSGKPSGTLNTGVPGRT